MASITFPYAPSGVTFSVNTFDTIAWSPSDSMVAAGSQTETAGNHSNQINLTASNVPMDLSTLGSITGNITAASVHYAHQGTYSTAGPGALYSFAFADDTKSQADGASWSHSADWDVTAFFTDGISFFTDMADLPTYPFWGLMLAGGGSIENGVTFGYQITALSIDFTYDSAAPVVTDVSPTHGDASGNDVVTITGTDLLSVTSVLFGATAAASFTVESDTQITAVSPSHAVGAVTVTVS